MTPKIRPSSKRAVCDARPKESNGATGRTMRSGVIAATSVLSLSIAALSCGDGVGRLGAPQQDFSDQQKGILARIPADAKVVLSVAEPARLLSDLGALKTFATR